MSYMGVLQFARFAGMYCTVLSPTIYDSRYINEKASLENKVFYQSELLLQA